MDIELTSQKWSDFVLTHLEDYYVRSGISWDAVKRIRDAISAGGVPTGVAWIKHFPRSYSSTDFKIKRGPSPAETGREHAQASADYWRTQQGAAAAILTTMLTSKPVLPKSNG